MSGAPTSPRSLTDWERVDALRDENIDLSDCPEITPEMFSRAIVRRGRKPTVPREKLMISLDADLAAWYKAQGRSYQQQINAILRAYKEAHQET
ncbi:MAG: BrnA antitoxin family protein [bacterium]|nr:BrnA antitoxin family protein [bacterium]